MNTGAVNKPLLKKYLIRFLLAALVTMALTGLLVVSAKAASVTFDLGNSAGEGDGAFGVVELLFLVTLIALTPSILIMMTSFTRIIIVLSFMRSALGTQQSPPNQVLVGMALFLSLYIMQPVLSTINEQAYQPYKEGIITQQEFLDTAAVPLKEFMLRQTYTDDLNLFLSLSRDGRTAGALIVNGPEDLTEIGLEVIVPSFMTSELKRAFNIGFLLFIPFLIIDLVVSSTLMSMGMVMLPPSMIALPFKIMMFVLVDGWGLLFGNLVKGFR